MTRQVIEGMRARKLRPRHQHLVHQRPEGPDGPGQLFGRQGRRLLGFTKALAQEGAAQGHHRQRHRPGYIDTEMVKAVPKEVLESQDHAARSLSAASARRKRSRAASSFLAADEAGFITGLHRRQRRPVHGVSVSHGRTVVRPPCRAIAAFTL